MRKKNKIIIGILIGSIAVLTGVILYAEINNQGAKEGLIVSTQENIYEDTTAMKGVLEETVSDDLVFAGEGIGYSEEKINIPAIQALAGNNDTDCSIQTMELVSYSQTIEDSNEAEGVIVTPETFGSDDTIYVVCIGYDVVDIEDGSFSNLKNLKEIRVDSRNSYYTAFNGCLYTKDLSTLICIPQNTTSVQVIASITGYTPHALDGLEQSRIDKLNSVLDGSYFAKQEETYPTTQKLERYATVDENNQALENYRHREGGEFSDSSTTGRTQDSNTQSYVDNNEKAENNDEIVANDANVDNSNTDIDVVDIGEDDDHTEPSRSSSTDFSQYVYNDGKHICFKYTGSGDTSIIIPEGVEKIVDFTASSLEWNDTVTYIYIPSSVVTMSMYTMFGKVDEDTNYYNCFYRCRNLETVEGGGYSYQCNGSSVTRPGNITVWSRNKRIPYDEQAYINYNNR